MYFRHQASRRAFSLAILGCMLGASLLPSPSLAACLKGVAGGDTHSLALLDDGTVYAWGSNDYGQLGNGTTTNSFLPAPVTGLTGGSFLGGEQEGEEHSLALMGDGTVMAWGANFAGQLGNGTNIDSSVPVPVTGLTNVIDIAGHEWWSQALASDGTVWAWGHNFWGQLGDGSTTLANVPVRVVGLTSVVNIAGGGDFHAIALRSDGTVWSWGQGTSPFKVVTRRNNIS